jgi:hypothetical protein
MRAYAPRPVRSNRDMPATLFGANGANTRRSTGEIATRHPKHHLQCHTPAMMLPRRVAAFRVMKTCSTDSSAFGNETGGSHVKRAG